MGAMTLITCALVAFSGFTACLADSRGTQKDAAKVVALPSSPQGDPVVSEPDVAQKQDVNHVLADAGKTSGSGAFTGSGSFSSAGSISSSGSVASNPEFGTDGENDKEESGRGLRTSYNPSFGAQDNYPYNYGAYPFYPSQNAIPTYGQGIDYQQNYLQQQFLNFQRQHQAFLEQIQAQNLAGGYSWASSSASMTNSDGSVNPNAQVYSYSRSSPGMAFSASTFGSGRNSGDFSNRFAPHRLQNRLGNGFSDGGFGGSRPYVGNSGFGGPYSGPGIHSAVSSVQIGPQGGQQAAEISPVGPNIESRFTEDIPAPSGGSYGVFTSSSSSHSIGPDGKETSQKTAITGVNDNGKITIHSVHDP